MSDLSDEEWEKFLAEDESAGTSAEQKAGNSTPFAASDSDEPIDPLIFVQSEEAPELRFQPPAPTFTPTNNSEQEAPAPYFVQKDLAQEEWVPAGELTDNTEIVSNTSNIVMIIVRLLLFMLPIGIIGVTFAVALSIE